MAATGLELNWSSVSFASAAITRVGGRVDPVSQTIKVFGEIRGEAAELMAGMSGRANIPPPK